MIQLSLIDQSLISKLMQNNQPQNTQNSTRKFIIIGGGPVGIYQAYLLLSSIQKCTITIYEKSNKYRPQVTGTAYRALDQLPQIVKQRLWPNQQRRSQIFSPNTWSNQDLIPSPGYQYSPQICFTKFQNVLREYLQENYGQRFQFILKQASIEQICQMRESRTVEAIFITTGATKAAFELRKQVSIDKIYSNDFESRQQINKFGIYFVYKGKGFQSYKRKDHYIDRLFVIRYGIACLASNDQQYHVQLYTLPIRTLRPIYQKISFELSKKLKFDSEKEPLSFSKCEIEKRLQPEQAQLILQLIEETKRILKQMQIELPEDNQVRIYSAPRAQLSFEKVCTQPSNLKPLIFIGDSAGYTDFKIGISFGRGLLASLFLAESVGANREMNLVCEQYQKYWESILGNQFNQQQPQKLASRNDMVFKYRIQGRTIDNARVNFKQHFCSYDQLAKKSNTKVPIFEL